MHYERDVTRGESAQARARRGGKCRGKCIDCSQTYFVSKLEFRFLHYFGLQLHSCQLCIQTQIVSEGFKRHGRVVRAGPEEHLYPTCMNPEPENSDMGANEL